MRKYYWYISAFFRKHGILVGLSLVFTIIGFSIFIPFAASRFNPKPRHFVGMVGNYTINTLPREVKELISIGLTKSEEDGSASPGIASRWIVENEATNYRFVIAKNLVWQDGKKLEPSDIKYPFTDVETVTTVNDVIFKLPDAYSPFPTIVSEPLIRFVTKPYFYFFKREEIIGLGEYKVAKFTTSGQRVKEIVLDSPKDIIVFRFYLTEQEAILGFKKGEVDILEDMSQSGDLSKWKTVEIQSNVHPERYSAIFFDLNKPKFAKNIRQGLAYALVKGDETKRATGPINSKSWAYLEGGKTYDYDLTRAIERVMSEIPEENIVIELTTTPAFTQQAENIKRDWEALGDALVPECQKSKEVKDKNVCNRLDIVVNIKINNFPDTTNFEALLIGQESPVDPDQYYLWHSGQSTNFSSYKNTRIDSLLEKGRKEIDKQERKAIYQEFQQFLLEDIPAIFLEQLESYTIRRTNS